MLDLKIKYNELTAEQFIELWETVWGDGPSLEQTRLAMKHTIFRVSIWDGDCIVAMARMNGDMGLNYYIKDVVVRPEYQGKGIGRILIDELRRFINNNGVKGTDIFVNLNHYCFKAAASPLETALAKKVHTTASIRPCSPTNRTTKINGFAAPNLEARLWI